MSLQNGEKKFGLDFSSVSPDGGLDPNHAESKLMVKPRKTVRQVRRKTTGGIQLFETQHEHDEGTVKLEPADQVPQQTDFTNLGSISQNLNAIFGILSATFWHLKCYF